jgi:hypothetical protein
MRFWAILTAVLLLSAVAFGADEACPSAQAAKAGVSEFEGFHRVIAPVWHVAYPDSNFEKMLAAGPNFVKAFGEIAAIEPKMKNVNRKASFLTNREEMAKLVKRYDAACKAGNRDSVYVLLPALHEAFEKSAAACLPTPYPEFDGLMVTVNLIMNNHLPNNNTNGIVGSTETLVRKVKGLTAESLPEELKNQEKSVMVEFTSFGALAGQMQDACTKNDMAKYKLFAEEMLGKLKAFAEAYL